MARLHIVRLAALLVVASLIAWASAPVQGRLSRKPQHKADLKLFQDAKAPHGDQDLIGFFKSRLITEGESKRIEELIQKLASRVFLKEREQARRHRKGWPWSRLPLLRKVLLSNAELEVKQRAERSIKTIEEKSPNTLVAAAARLLAHRQVDGALTALMQYLPLAPDELVEEQISASIYSLALKGARLTVLPPAVGTGKLDPAMVTALADQQPVCRGIAALAVARYGDASQRNAVAKLLTDEDLGVRFRGCSGLASAGRQKWCTRAG